MTVRSFCTVNAMQGNSSSFHSQPCTTSSTRHNEIKLLTEITVYYAIYCAKKCIAYTLCHYLRWQAFAVSLNWREK